VTVICVLAYHNLCSKTALIMCAAVAAAGAHSAMLSMLQVAVGCNLPLGPLLDSCLRAVARWQVGA
jgi:hypothetical protein